jgi:hypothetical protein
MTTAYCGFSDGAKEANQDVSAFEVPSQFLPKTCAVPVLPLTATGSPANEPAPVPEVTTARSAACRKSIVFLSAGIFPFIIGSNFLTKVPSDFTIALAICGW